MKKILNKIIACVAVFTMVLSCGFLLTGCNGNNNPSRVMNLSLNPSIELVLDANDKVLSVNANNDEGNFVIANASFMGMSAEKAVELFLEINYENGFIVRGSVSAGENQLDIQISGNDAQKLFNKVKSSAENYLTNLGANVEVILAEILNRNNLEQLVAECRQELSTAEINGMTEQELLDAIKASRDETKNFLREELKDLYYQSRAEGILKKKFEAVINQLSHVLIIPGIDLTEIKNTLSTAFEQLTSGLENFKNTFKNQLLDAQSDYQLAMEKYLEAKKAILEANLQGVDTTVLENALALAESTLANANTLAENAIDLTEQAIDSALSTLNKSLDFIINLLDEGKINKAIANAQKEFNANFKIEFSSYINTNYWKNLKPSTQA